MLFVNVVLHFHLSGCVLFDPGIIVEVVDVTVKLVRFHFRGC
jgi:hypothetical protein